MELFIKQILQVQDPEKGEGERFSLSRVCLLISFLSILSLIIYSLLTDQDVQSSMDILYQLILIFSAYSFGNKAFKRYQDLMKKS